VGRRRIDSLRAPPNVRPSLRLEVNRHGDDHRDRYTPDSGRRVLPLRHGVERGLIKHGTDLTTLASATLPSGPMVASTCTVPPTRIDFATGGYTGITFFVFAGLAMAPTRTAVVASFARVSVSAFTLAAAAAAASARVFPAVASAIAFSLATG